MAFADFAPFVVETLVSNRVMVHETACVLSLIAEPESPADRESHPLLNKADSLTPPDQERLRETCIFSACFPCSGMFGKLGAIVTGDQPQAQGSGSNSLGLLKNFMLFLGYIGHLKKKKCAYIESEAFFIFTRAWVQLYALEETGALLRLFWEEVSAELWPEVCVWGLLCALQGCAVWASPGRDLGDQPRLSIWEMGGSTPTPGTAKTVKPVSKARALLNGDVRGPALNGIVSEIVLVTKFFKKNPFENTHGLLIPCFLLQLFLKIVVIDF